MELVSQIIGAPINALTLLGVMVVVGERLITGGWLNFNVGKEDKNITNMQLGAKMDILSTHFNHETTALLEDISAKLSTIITKQDDMLINGVRTRK